MVSTAQIEEGQMGWRGMWHVLVRRYDGKRQRGRTRRRWENNIEMDLEQMG